MPFILPALLIDETHKQPISNTANITFSRGNFEIPGLNGSEGETLSYFDHIDQVKRGLRPRTPRPSGPLGPERPAGLRGPHNSRLSITVVMEVSILKRA